jgi:hypothetical protein
MVLYLILKHFNYFQDYLHLLKLLLYRGIVFILFVIVLSFVSNILLWHDLAREFEIFNSSTNKSSFGCLLEKISFFIIDPNV